MAHAAVLSIETLGEPGDLTAEPGSRPWAIAMRGEMILCLSDTESNRDRLSWMHDEMTAQKGYTQLVNQHGAPFSTFREFCEAKPPWGLGYSENALNAIITEYRKQTARQRAERPKELREQHKKTLPSNVKRQGNDAEYLTARIARDRPDILERMKAGEYRSVRAAALDAGIIQPRISIPTDVEGAALALSRKFTVEDLHRLVELLAERIAVDVQ